MTRVNQQIRARQIRIIDEEGKQIGIMSPREALAVAQERGLDLVEVAESAVPPVCRIMDYGKYKYEQSKRSKTARKHQKTIEVKEITFHPDTGEHDYQFKAKHIERFIKSGAKVKASVIFFGREIVHSELGRQMLNRLATEMAEIAQVEQSPKLERKTMTMILAPKSHQQSAISNQQKS